MVKLNEGATQTSFKEAYILKLVIIQIIYSLHNNLLFSFHTDQNLVNTFIRTE